MLVLNVSYVALPLSRRPTQSKHLPRDPFIERSDYEAQSIVYPIQIEYINRIIKINELNEIRDFIDTIMDWLSQNQGIKILYLSRMEELQN